MFLQPHGSSPPNPAGSPQPRGTTSSRQGLPQGCGQHGENRGGSGRGCSGPPWGPQHRCSSLVSTWQAGGRAFPTPVPGPVPHHHLPGCFRASQPICRSDGHHHPTTAESGTTAHAPGSVFDCNIAVTDFPLPLAWVFLLRLSFPVPPPHLSPALRSCQGQGREDGNTGSSARDLAWDLSRGCRAPQTRHQTESLRTSRARREPPAVPEPPGAALGSLGTTPTGTSMRNPVFPRQLSPSFPGKGRQLPANVPTRCRRHTAQEPPAAPAKPALPRARDLATVPSRPPTDNFLQLALFS